MDYIRYYKGSLLLIKQIHDHSHFDWMPVGSTKPHSIVTQYHGNCSLALQFSITVLLLKAALSVTFDILILEIKFLFFKNTVKILKFR